MVHYIYIPGLGDRFDTLRRIALWRWRRSVRVTFVPMRWNDQAEQYEQKYTRVAKSIDSAGGDAVVLIGESAGAAMALLAFARRPVQVSGVITICGYNHGASDIAAYRRRRHPALHPLLQELDTVVPSLSVAQRRQITTIFSTNDYTVTPDHSAIDGARRVALHTPGHLLTIARVLLIGLRQYI